jgi:hypothetical protein
MGYSTDFYGQFQLDRPADPELQRILKGLNKTRRVKRNVDPMRYGVEGEFYFEGTGFMGQDDDPSILDHNRPPATQPGLWCQWELSDDNITIEWDGGEKFYDYIEWIKYIIERVLKPRKYKLNGVVEWQGEERDDIGLITIKNNKVTIKNGRITFK